MTRAILVREKVTRLVKLMVDKSIRVTQRGSRAFVEYGTDGRPRLVNIPYIPDEASEEFLAAIEGFLDHEVAHVLFTDYAALKKAKLGKVANLHNIIEDAFIEKKMAAQFAGSGLNLRNVGEFFLKTYTDVKLKEDPKNAVGVLIVPAIRALSGQGVYQDYMVGKWHHLDDVMSKIGEYAKEALPKISCSAEAVEVALKFKELLDKKDKKVEPPKPKEKPEPKSKPPKTPKSEIPSEPDAGADDTPEGEPESEPDDIDLGGESPPSREEPPEDEGFEGDELPKSDDMADDIDLDGADDDASADDEDTETPGDEDDERDLDESDAGGEGGAADSLSPSKSDAPEKSTTASELEDELEGEDFAGALAEALSAKAASEGRDCDYLIYTKELDIIEPMKIDGRFNDAMLKTMQDTVDHMVGPLQKDLERAIAARSVSTWTAGHRSGRLHPGAIARLTAFKDDRAFRRKGENLAVDAAVSLLIDCSGSMKHGGKITAAAYAAYGLASVLDRMNISNEVLGFTTRGSLGASEMFSEETKMRVSYARHERLYIPILKSFSERLSSENKKRFAALPEANWLSENVDGESVQIAAGRLMQRREKRKILIVLSDGAPACPGDFIALQKHLKKVVKDVERQGVDVLGLGIMTDSPKRFYTKCTVLNAVADLPTSVIGEIKRLLMRV